MQKISLIKPSDCHIHLRDDNFLARTVSDAESQFNNIIVMPNLQPPVGTVEDANNYKKRISQHMTNKSCNVYMALYLSQQTDLETIKLAAKSKDIIGFKLYPEGVTTNSEQGIRNIKSMSEVLSWLEEYQVPLMIHGEDNKHGIDIFDKEKSFIDSTLSDIHTKFPKLKITLEHITTKEAVDFVLSTPPNIAATITCHHLWLNRNDVINTKIHPHNFCLPVAKRRHHQEALIAAAISSNSKFFLGTDSAPHTIENKESSCGCAGIYTASHAIELYTEIFDNYNALDKLESFASINGPKFYNMSVTHERISLVKSPNKIPLKLEFGDSVVVPFRAGLKTNWQLINKE